MAAMVICNVGCLISRPIYEILKNFSIYLFLDTCSVSTIDEKIWNVNFNIFFIKLTELAIISRSIVILEYKHFFIINDFI